MKNEPSVITFAERDAVDSVQEVIEDFMTKIFGTSLDDCFVSDESELWDFAMCAIPETMDLHGIDLETAQSLAEQIVKTRFREFYDIEVEIFDTLPVTAARILEAQKIH